MKNQTIIITMQESQRYDIIQNLINGHINGTETAKQMNLSVRQVRRIKGRVRKEGIKGLVHKNRGKSSNNKLPREELKRIKRIMKTEYYYLPTRSPNKFNIIHCPNGSNFFKNKFRSYKRLIKSLN